jgi:hypothetical protein
MAPQRRVDRMSATGELGRRIWWIQRREFAWQRREFSWQASVNLLGRVAEGIGERPHL